MDGEPLTIGVEEEFFLVDAVSRENVSASALVLDRAGEHPSWGTGGDFHLELFDTQLEGASGVCVDLSELRRQLGEARTRLAAAARDVDLRLVATGTPVLASATHGPAASERFARISQKFAGAMANYQVCGCHVHIGVADREMAVAVVNHLRPWLPTLLALSVNSPFHQGTDTGYASWRTMDMAKFPGAGTPPWFASAAAYERRLDQLVDCGVLVDTTMTFWLARASTRLPTVEIRAADSAATVDEAVLQAALTRALVRTALADLARGREAEPVAESLCAAGLWSAARHGLAGPAVHPFQERAVDAGYLLGELVTLLRPALEEDGDLNEVAALLHDLRRGGTGAVRQRRIAPLGATAVVDMLVKQTLLGWLVPPRASARS